MIRNSIDESNFSHKLLLTNTQASKICKTCVLVNNNLCGKFVLSTEFAIKLDERFKVDSVPFFIAGFRVLKKRP